MKGYSRYFRDKDLWISGSEKDGWYLEDDRMVQRVKCYRVPVPEGATFIKSFAHDPSIILFTHPSFDEVRDGDRSPNIPLKEDSGESVRLWEEKIGLKKGDK